MYFIPFSMTVHLLLVQKKKKNLTGVATKSVQIELTFSYISQPTSLVEYKSWHLGKIPVLIIVPIIYILA